MNAFWALTLALGAWQTTPAAGSRPELTMIDAEAPTAALLITFRVGYGDDLGLGGLTSQAQAVLIQANQTLSARFAESCFANGVTLSTRIGLGQTHFVLTGPRAGVHRAGHELLTALWNPRIDPSRYALLKARGGGGSDLASDTELVLGLVEPLVVEGGDQLMLRKFRWQSLERLKEHIAEFFCPANASIVLIGLDGSKLRGPLQRSGGKRRQYTRVTFASDVRTEIPSRSYLHVFGYPLHSLSASQTAGMRVVTHLLFEHLFAELRQRGLAYAISVEHQFTPTFRAVFLSLPAFDSSGLDLEPMLTGLISEALHRQYPTEELNRLIRTIQLEDERLATNPAALADDLVRGKREACWSSSEYSDALAALTPESLGRIVSSLFLNERKRFYLSFHPVTKTRGGR